MPRVTSNTAPIKPPTKRSPAVHWLRKKSIWPQSFFLFADGMYNEQRVHRNRLTLRSTETLP